MEKYNKLLSENWVKAAEDSNSQLLFALSVNDKKEVFFFWDNARGNVALLDYLKQVVAQNKNTNYG